MKKKNKNTNPNIKKMVATTAAKPFVFVGNGQTKIKQGFRYVGLTLLIR